MPGDMRIPTLEDVARLAGVSTATVSRCLNLPDKVSQSTRDKVLKAVETLGYTPNFGAKVMAARRTMTIGAIIPTMDNTIFARGIQAFQEALEARGYTLLVASSSYQPEAEAAQIRNLVGRGADGLLLIGFDRSPGTYDYLHRIGIPTLVAWTYQPDGLLPSIGFDNRAAMRTLAAEVIAQGHRRIGIISGVLAGNDRATGRLLGIRDALAAAGLPDGDLPVVETPYEVDNGAEAFAQLMAPDTPPTVVMCGNDVLAVGALQRAQDMGLEVPGDISITGFDDIELSCIVRPQLTTMHVPHRQMGSRAAMELVRMVETKSDGTSQELPVRLVRRGTLGPAKRP